MEKYAKMKNDMELKDCTFMPKTNNYRKKRSKTSKPLNEEIKPVEAAKETNPAEVTKDIKPTLAANSTEA